MTSTKMIILLGAVIFQYCVSPSEAYNGKSSIAAEHVPESPTPEEVLKEFEDLVNKLVPEAQDTITTTLEYADVEILKLLDRVQKQLDAKHLKFTNNLAVIKAESDSAGVDVSNCIGDAKHTIDDSLTQNHAIADECVSDYNLFVKSHAEHVRSQLDSSYRILNAFRRLFELCGTSQECKEDEAVKVRRAISKTPKFIEDDVNLVEKEISTARVKGCIPATLDRYDNIARRSVNTAFKCLHEKIHSITEFL